MDYIELIITIGLLILVTGLYIILRKFIAWAIDDDNQWHKKRGNLGLGKDTLNTNKELAYYRLTAGYLMVMGVLVLYLIKLFVDAT